MSFIAVDLGATNLRVATGDKNGIQRKISEKTDRVNGPNGVANQIIKMVKSLNPNPEAIGIGSIGPIDIKAGKIVRTSNLPFNDVSLVDPISVVFKTEVKLLNDCSAAVLGEHFFGAGKDTQNLVYITLSTGLGCGAIVDDHLLSGKDGNAHEAGHITIDPNSELRCGCGCIGHWEAFSSGVGIPKFLHLLIKKNNLQNRSSTLTQSDLLNLDSREIFKMANEGNTFVLNFLEELGKVNAQGFGDVVNIYDPELITVGGSIALNNPDLIINPIIKGIDKHLINRKPKICITPLGGDVVLYGALSYALGLKH
jgi:glucokinase